MEIDWEQRRYEIAKAMMITVATHENFIINSPTTMAATVVSYTDALIEKLKWNTGK